jgi:hypothetical protein
MVWVGHVTYVADDKNLKRQRHSRNAVVVGMITLKRILREYGLRASRFSCESSEELTGFIKWAKFLDRRSNCPFLKKVVLHCVCVVL